MLHQKPLLVTFVTLVDRIPMPPPPVFVKQKTAVLYGSLAREYVSGIGKNNVDSVRTIKRNASAQRHPVHQHGADR